MVIELLGEINLEDDCFEKAVKINEIIGAVNMILEAHPRLEERALFHKAAVNESKRLKDTNRNRALQNSLIKDDER